MISLGGVGNVVANLVVAKQQVTIISVIGDDEAGEELQNLLKQLNVDCTYLLKEDNRITSVKNRFLGENKQQLLRHDHERVQNLTERNQLYLTKVILQSIENFDLIVISDYGKGVCSISLLKRIISICKTHRVPVICDVKGVDATKYIGASLIKPNLKELKQLTGLSVETDEKIVQAASFLCKKCEAEYILTTCGANGMVLVDKYGQSIKIEGHQCEVYDVTGAGIMVS